MRYGMRYSTIRYWQNQAQTLKMLIDWKPKAFSCTLGHKPRNARNIAHDAIQCAWVLTADEMRQLLTWRA